MDIFHKILFIYNTDGSIFGDIASIVSRITAPKEYKCDLCYITYKTPFMNKKWKAFIENLPYKAVFLHKDDVGEKFPQLSELLLPAIVLANNNGNYAVVLEKGEMTKEMSVEDLILLVKSKLKQIIT